MSQSNPTEELNAAATGTQWALAPAALAAPGVIVLMFMLQAAKKTVLEPSGGGSPTLGK